MSGAGETTGRATGKASGNATGNATGKATGGATGERIVRASWAGTALLFATSLLAVLFDEARAVAVVADLVLFLGGSVIFFWAYATAVGRSRQVEIGIGGLFFLAGTAPKDVRRQLMASLALEVVIAFAAAAARPFTPLAFGVLVPIWALALAGLWGAKYGTFAPRVPREPRQRRTAARPAPAAPPPVSAGDSNDSNDDRDDREDAGKGTDTA